MVLGSLTEVILKRAGWPRKRPSHSCTSSAARREATLRGRYVMGWGAVLFRESSLQNVGMKTDVVKTEKVVG